MRAKVTEDCIACERCVEICPEVFKMGEEFAEVIIDSIPLEFEDGAKQAAEECPTSAIIIEE